MTGSSRAAGDGLLTRTTSHDRPALPNTNSSWDVQVRPHTLMKLWPTRLRDRHRIFALPLQARTAVGC